MGQMPQMRAVISGASNACRPRRKASNIRGGSKMVSFTSSTRSPRNLIWSAPSPSTRVSMSTLIVLAGIVETSLKHGAGTRYQTASTRVSRREARVPAPHCLHWYRQLQRGFHHRVVGGALQLEAYLLADALHDEVVGKNVAGHPVHLLVLGYFEESAQQLRSQTAVLEFVADDQRELGFVGALGPLETAHCEDARLARGVFVLGD